MKSSAHHSVDDGGKPFATPSGMSSGPGSGLWGDTYSGPSGDHIGCMPGRRYALAVTLHNRSQSAVTITDVRGSEPAPRIIRRVAVQLRLAPPPPNNNQQGDLTSGGAAAGRLMPWSRSPLVPIVIPPGRSAVVQSNFLMRACRLLRHGQTITANHAISVAYTVGQQTGRQTVTQPGAQIILTRGPTARPCSTPQGSTVLTAYDIPCDLAQTAAVACHKLDHGSYGECTAAGQTWDCGFNNQARTRERCWLPSKRQNFAVRWN